MGLRLNCNNDLRWPFRDMAIMLLNFSMQGEYLRTSDSRRKSSSKIKISQKGTGSFDKGRRCADQGKIGVGGSHDHRGHEVSMALWARRHEDHEAGISPYESWPIPRPGKQATSPAVRSAGWTAHIVLLPVILQKNPRT